MNTDRRLVLAGIALLAIGLSGGLVAALSLADAQARHGAGCVTVPTGPQSAACTSIENEIHLWQGAEYVSILGFGTGVWLLVAMVRPGPRRRAPLPDRGYAVHR